MGIPHSLDILLMSAFSRPAASKGWRGSSSSLAFSADIGYKAFTNHADIWYHLNARPFIAYPKNAVISKEGETDRIDHWVNKMWKIGGDVYANTEAKQNSSNENGRAEQVRMYLRNQNMRDKYFLSLYKKRGECEPKHGHIKDVVKFDIRRVRVESRRLYSLLNFVSYQLLVLTELQKQFMKTNSFGIFYLK